MKMAGKSKFPTMGTEPANASVAGVHEGTLVPKSGNAKGGSGDPATAVVRPHSNERLGFKGAPQMTMSYPQAPEATQTFRNVRLYRSAVGNRDFYDRRQYGQTGDFG